MCDSPELHSVVPRRSGSEFIARLLELEHFAKSADVLHFESYGGGPADLSGSVPQEAKGMLAVGRVSTDGLGLPPNPIATSTAPGSRLLAMADFLEDELWLPYQEPKILHHHAPQPCSRSQSQKGGST